MPKKNTKKNTAELSERENYLRNRNNMLEDFQAALKETQLDEPSVGGEIAGMNFQQFSASTVFLAIKDQEEYIEYSEKFKPEYVLLAEEKVILQDMIKQAKEVFGQDYDAWYKNAER
jgi:hypothetical protein